MSSINPLSDIIRELKQKVETQKEQIFAWRQLSQTLVDELHSQHNELEVLRAAIALAAGMLSTLPEFENKEKEIMKMLKSYGESVTKKEDDD